ncbi:hypothetical protein [Halovivax cerinus]|uniref:Uncharacterized protein n=1 Tax=Halovivax cerinus TaxID=1487865 RepID=A0ABD5NIQ8_9EURY|nr:hypothetical protein [Halovivax cerinus]
MTRRASTGPISNPSPTGSRTWVFVISSTAFEEIHQQVGAFGRTAV